MQQPLRVSRSKLPIDLSLNLITKKLLTAAASYFVHVLLAVSQRALLVRFASCAKMTTPGTKRNTYRQKFRSTVQRSDATL